MELRIQPFLVSVTVSLFMLYQSLVEVLEEGGLEVEIPGRYEIGPHEYRDNSQYHQYENYRVHPEEHSERDNKEYRRERYLDPGKGQKRQPEIEVFQPKRRELVAVGIYERSEEKRYNSVYQKHDDQLRSPHSHYVSEVRVQLSQAHQSGHSHYSSEDHESEEVVLKIIYPLR